MTVPLLSRHDEVERFFDRRCGGAHAERSLRGFDLCWGQAIGRGTRCMTRRKRLVCVAMAIELVY